MRTTFYEDGTPTREMQDDDWESTGGDEVNKLYEEKVSVVSIRDHLGHLRSLVELCMIALTHKDWKGQDYVQCKVADVLCDYVGPEIEKIDEELRHV